MDDDDVGGFDAVVPISVSYLPPFCTRVTHEQQASVARSLSVRGHNIKPRSLFFLLILCITYIQ